MALGVEGRSSGGGTFVVVVVVVIWCRMRWLGLRGAAIAYGAFQAIEQSTFYCSGLEVPGDRLERVNLLPSLRSGSARCFGMS